MKNRKHTDICYIYEENPEVGRTGDSVFIRQLAKDFPEYRFHIAKISGTPSSFSFRDHVDIPNIDEFQLIDLSFHGNQKERGKSSVSFREAAPFFRSVAKAVESGGLDRDFINQLFDAAGQLAPKVQFEALWKDPTSWDLIKALYSITPGEIPFVEHRDLLNEMLNPLWRLASKAVSMPKAEIYQADSGIRSAILGMMAARMHGGRFVMVDDCLPLNALVRERRSIKLHDGGVWRPEYEAFQRARNNWTQSIRNHCLMEADEILANTMSSATKIRERVGANMPIRIVREGIEGETTRRWGAYYSKQEELQSYRVLFLIGAYKESRANAISNTIQKVESRVGTGTFVVLSLSATTEADEEMFNRLVKETVKSIVRFAPESKMIEEIGGASVVAFPSQMEGGDRSIINSLHAGKPVVVSMIDVNSIFADPRISVETDCFATPNRLEGREFPNALISLIRRKDNLAYHPRMLGEALFNHREIMEGYAKLYNSLTPSLVIS